MAYEIDYQKDATELFRVPRRFETFDEAWETAKKLSDTLIDRTHGCWTLQFRKVK